MAFKLHDFDLNILRDKSIGLNLDGFENKILILKRYKGESFTYPCPFCGAATHFHGKGDGHKVIHCTGIDPDLQFVNSKGDIFRVKDGYFLLNEDEERFP